MNKNLDLVYEYSREMKHEKYMREVPYLKFDADWEIKVLLPFAGAMLRFMVKKQDVEISVYLDCFGNLGAVSHPYWEIYPAENGDCFRCDMSDTDSLINEIRKSINSRL